MDIGKGKFSVYTERGVNAQIPLKVTHKYEQPGCHVCLDYVANFADISTGSVGTPDGWSTVFVRSAAGEAAFNKAVEAGWIIAESMDGVKPGLELVTKLATEKITKNQKYIEHRAHAEHAALKPLRNPYI
jgi:coenzyme F420 hydrogenase subunit beta